MIWWFYTNFSVKGQNLFPGQHVTTFELSCNQRLNLAQSWKIKIILKSYCFSRLPKGFCKEKASSRFAKRRKGKTGQNLWKTDQQVVNNFFGALLQLKSKNSEQMLESQLYRAHCQKNSDQKDDLVILFEFFCPRTESVFWTARHNFWTFLQSEAKLGRKLKRKDTMMLLQ